MEELFKEANWLISKYNELLLDEDIKDKQQVRDWFNCMIQPLIISGVPQYKFLYCEATLLSIEKLKELYHISDKDNNKYREKYQNLKWFEMIKKQHK